MYTLITLEAAGACGKEKRLFDLDLVLAILHHLAVFGFVGVMAAEYGLLRPGLSGERLQLLGRIDAAYGTIAGLVILAGVLRVIFGAAGYWYYLTNWAFWAKMAAFIVVGALSAPATRAILGWRKEGAENPSFVPEAAAVSRARNMLHVQFAVLVLVPTFAAVMARGYGVMG